MSARRPAKGSRHKGVHTMQNENVHENNRVSGALVFFLPLQTMFAHITIKLLLLLCEIVVLVTGRGKLQNSQPHLVHTYDE